MITEPKFLEKIADFTKVALGEIEGLEYQIHQLKKKEAGYKAIVEEKDAKYSAVLKKVSAALYSADFLTDEFEQKQFLKQAKENPAFLAETLIKVCQASDVSSIGAPSKTAKLRSSDDKEFDPVYARAFGLDNSLVFDE